MNKVRGTLVWAVLMGWAPLASADTTPWALDLDHTEFGFNVKHMAVSNIHGSFHGAQMELDWDAKDPTKSKLDVTVDVKTIDTRSEKRDGHLKSPDFFDAEKYPVLKFKASKFKKKGKGYDVMGELTIRDVTKPITLTVDGPVAPFKDPFGMTRSAFNAKAKISRKDFGLTWNKTLETGGLLVGDEVMIDINGEITRKDAPKAEASAETPTGTAAPAAK